jgi:hypothetical protein|eukprot:COSAG01_NODE_1475_length_10189_cov_9.333399_11_plen_137_part_00
MDEYTKRNDPAWEMASDHGDVKFLLVSKPAELSASGKWRAPQRSLRVLAGKQFRRSQDCRAGPSWHDSCVVCPAYVSNAAAAFHQDNCGDDQGKDFNVRVDAINASGKPMMIENSNQGFGNPARGPCKGSVAVPME